MDLSCKKSQMDNLDSSTSINKIEKLEKDSELVTNIYQKHNFQLLVEHFFQHVEFSNYMQHYYAHQNIQQLHQFCNEYHYICLQQKRNQLLQLETIHLQQQVEYFKDCHHLYFQQSYFQHFFQFMKYQQQHQHLKIDEITHLCVNQYLQHNIQRHYQLQLIKQKLQHQHHSTNLQQTLNRKTPLDSQTKAIFQKNNKYEDQDVPASYKSHPLNETPNQGRVSSLKNLELIVDSCTDERSEANDCMSQYSETSFPDGKLHLGKILNREETLRRHRNTQYNIPKYSEIKFNLETDLEKQFSERNNGNQHFLKKKDHNKNFLELDCPKQQFLAANCSNQQFSERKGSRFSGHERFHKCNYCGRKFRQKANRDRHLCLHTGSS